MKQILRIALQKLFWFTFPGGVPSYSSLTESQAHNCVLGKGSKIYPQAKINNSPTRSESIVVGDNTHVAGILSVWSNTGRIDIGSDSFIGEGTRVFAAMHVVIGDRVQIAHNCNIFDCNVHSLDAEERHIEYLQNIQSGQIRMHDLRENEVIIEDDAWLGACVIVLKGVRIGEGAIIGAGSVVTRDIPRYTVAVGNPARVIKSLAAKKDDPFSL